MSFKGAFQLLGRPQARTKNLVEGSEKCQYHVGVRLRYTGIKNLEHNVGNFP